MGFKELINSAAKWGLLLGVVYSVSKVYEMGVTAGGDVTDFAILSAEWVAMIVFGFYVLYRANKVHSRLTPPEVEYGFRAVINYTILIVAFAGVISGIASHIYIENVVGGYDVYAQMSVDTINRIYSDLDSSTNIAPLLEEIEKGIPTLSENPPSILSTVMSTVANYIAVGFFGAIVVTFFVRRKAVVAERGGGDE